MSKEANAIIMLCVWGFITIAKYYELFVSTTFNPNFFDWFLLIGGPLIIILEIWQLYKAKRDI